MARILVVEDHAAIARGIRENLEVEGHHVRIAVDGREAIDVALEWQPDLVTLDLLLPGRDGFQVLAALRGTGAMMPILVLSARGSEAEKVRALRAGADDYLVKPFGVLELVARIEALLRRGGGTPAAPERYEIGTVQVDVGARTVTRGGRPLVLRPKEHDLLVALLRARGAVVSRADLLVRVWGYDPAVVTRTVDTHVAALRQRLEDDPDDPRLILTVWKRGYRIATLPQGSDSVKR